MLLAAQLCKHASIPPPPTGLLCPPVHGAPDEGDTGNPPFGDGGWAADGLASAQVTVDSTAGGGGEAIPEHSNDQANSPLSVGVGDGSDALGTGAAQQPAPPMEQWWVEGSADTPDDVVGGGMILGAGGEGKEGGNGLESSQGRRKKFTRRVYKKAKKESTKAVPVYSWSMEARKGGVREKFTATVEGEDMVKVSLLLLGGGVGWLLGFAIW